MPNYKESTRKGRFLLYNGGMVGERLSNSNPEKEEAEIKQKNWRVGSRILETIQKVFNKEQGPKSEYYLLSENMPLNSGRSFKEKKYWDDLYKGWDECGVDIPIELGKMIEEEVKNPNSWFGIHNSYGVNGANYEQDAILHEILTKGLENAGDSSSGIVYNDPPVDKTVWPCTNMFNTVARLKSSYKGSTGAVLISIPKEYLDDDNKVKEGMETIVYDHNELGNSRIKPEFIVGFVQNLGVREDGKNTVLEYKSREELLAGYKGDELQ